MLVGDREDVQPESIRPVKFVVNGTRYRNMVVTDIMIAGMVE